MMMAAPRDHALCDGEDFELILAVPPDAAAQILHDQPLDCVRLTDIGEFVAEAADCGPATRATSSPSYNLAATNIGLTRPPTSR